MTTLGFPSCTLRRHFGKKSILQNFLLQFPRPPPMASARLPGFHSCVMEALRMLFLRCRDRCSTSSPKRSSQLRLSPCRIRGSENDLCVLLVVRIDTCHSQKKQSRNRSKANETRHTKFKTPKQEKAQSRRRKTNQRTTTNKSKPRGDPMQKTERTKNINKFGFGSPLRFVCACFGCGFLGLDFHLAFEFSAVERSEAFGDRFYYV